MKSLGKLGTAVVIATLAIGVSAQQGPAPYGAPLSLDMARKVAAAAEAEAKKNGWPVAIAVVDSGSHLVLLQRLDNTQYSAAEIATQKANSAVSYRRPTKAFEDVLAAGGAGLRVMSFPGALPAEGGLPIIVDGKIVGGIGVSGVTGQQDGQVAKAGAEALKP